jgi:hypothetical protein
MDEVTLNGTTYRAEVINGQRVLVTVVPEARLKDLHGTSTDHVRGKGARRRYHRSGNAPAFKPGNRSVWK